MADELKPLQDVARASGAGINRVRYWCQLLGVTPIKRDGVRLVPVDVAAQLEYMAALVASGTAPAAAAGQVRAMPADARVVTNPAAIAATNPDNLPVPAGRVEQLERAILAMAEAHRNQVADLRAQLSDMAAAMARENEARRLDADQARRQSDETNQRLAQLEHLARQERDNRANAERLAAPPRQVTPWQPPARPDPLAGKPGWYRLWVELVAPEKLRRDN